MLDTAMGLAVAPSPPEHLAKKCGNVRDVSTLTGIPKSTLDKLRSIEPVKSPPFFKVGARVYYPLHGPDSLETWLAARVAQSPQRGAMV